MFAIFKDETLVALEYKYSKARLVQMSTRNPLEFYVIEVESLMELRNIMDNTNLIKKGLCNDFRPIQRCPDDR